MYGRDSFWIAASAALFLGIFVLVLVEPDPTRLDLIADDLLRAPEGQDPWGDEAEEVAVDYALMAVIDTALVLAAWKWGSVRSAVVVILAIAVQEVVIRASKAVTERPRPEDAFSVTGAYPSGHVANFSIAVLLFFLIVLPLLRQRGIFAREVRGEMAVAAAIVVTYALYRVFAGEHWITDVIGAVALATAFASGARIVLRKTRTEKP